MCVVWYCEDVCVGLLMSWCDSMCACVHILMSFCVCHCVLSSVVAAVTVINMSFGSKEWH